MQYHNNEINILEESQQKTIFKSGKRYVDRPSSAKCKMDGHMRKLETHYWVAVGTSGNWRLCCDLLNPICSKGKSVKQV